MNKKTSGTKMASEASSIMRQKSSSQIQKSLAASVLSQRDSNKVTGSRMEDIASKVLQSNKYSDITKSLAASVLSQSDTKR